MAYDLIVTDAAHSDLDDALEYISGRLANPTAAANLFAEVEKCYAQLRAFPFLYEACKDERLKSLGYHKVVIGHYILVFRPDEAARTVYILRFFYGGMDYEKML